MIHGLSDRIWKIIMMFADFRTVYQMRDFSLTVRGIYQHRLGREDEQLEQLLVGLEYDDATLVQVILDRNHAGLLSNRMGALFGDILRNTLTTTRSRPMKVMRAFMMSGCPVTPGYCFDAIFIEKIRDPLTLRLLMNKLLIRDFPWLSYDQAMVENEHLIMMSHQGRSSPEDLVNAIRYIQAWQIMLQIQDNRPAWIDRVLVVFSHLVYGVVVAQSDYPEWAWLFEAVGSYQLFRPRPIKLSDYYLQRRLNLEAYRNWVVMLREVRGYPDLVALLTWAYETRGRDGFQAMMDECIIGLGYSLVDPKAFVKALIVSSSREVVREILNRFVIQGDLTAVARGKVLREIHLNYDVMWDRLPPVDPNRINIWSHLDEEFYQDLARLYIKY